MDKEEIAILSGTEKAKLQAMLKDLKFANTSETDKYRCQNCGQIALYHYMASCKHIFCGICHGQHYKHPCPIRSCTNKSIKKIKQNLEFEFGLYQLIAYCKFQQNGCAEKMVLQKLLDHQEVCEFSTTNLLPKLWVPHKKDEYIIQLEKEVNSMKEIINGLTKRIDKMSYNFEAFSESLDSKINVKVSTKTEDLENKIIKTMQQLETEQKILNNNMEANINKVKQDVLSKITDISAAHQLQVNTEKEYLSNQIETLAKDMENKILIVEQMFDGKLEMLTNKLASKQTGAQRKMEGFYSTGEELQMRRNLRDNSD